MEGKNGDYEWLKLYLGYRLCWLSHRTLYQESVTDLAVFQPNATYAHSQHLTVDKDYVVK
jgi:hypothetical protein